MTIFDTTGGGGGGTFTAGWTRSRQPPKLLRKQAPSTERQEWGGRGPGAGWVRRSGSEPGGEAIAGRRVGRQGGGGAVKNGDLLVGGEGEPTGIALDRMAVGDDTELVACVGAVNTPAGGVEAHTPDVEGRPEGVGGRLGRPGGGQ